MPYVNLTLTCEACGRTFDGHRPQQRFCSYRCSNGSRSTSRRCSVGGCIRKHQARGYCDMHYRRLLRCGSPDGRPVRGTEGWLAARVIVDRRGCWIWEGNIESKGYGQIRLGAIHQQAHRYIYELLVGLIPNGLELDHLCRVKRCVNPDHLEPVTHQVNSARAVAASPIRRAQSQRAKGALR